MNCNCNRCQVAEVTAYFNVKSKETNVSKLEQLLKQGEERDSEFAEMLPKPFDSSQLANFCRVYSHSAALELILAKAELKRLRAALRSAVEILDGVCEWGPYPEAKIVAALKGEG